MLGLFLIFNLKQICSYQIVKNPEKYGQELKGFPSRDQKVINSLFMLWSKAAILFPKKKELKKRLYLVHATNFFPKNAVLKAGAYNKVTQNFETMRKSCSFFPESCGSVHGPNNCDDSKFVFIIPLEEKKLINLSGR